MDIRLCQQREQQLVDMMHEAVLLSDPNGIILHANPIACQSLGKSLSALQQQPLTYHLILREDGKNTLIHSIQHDQNGLPITHPHLCGEEVRKLHLLPHNQLASIALIWRPTNDTSFSKDKHTGLPDMEMFSNQLSHLLQQTDSVHPHSIIRIQLATSNSHNMQQAEDDHLESLVGDIATLMHRGLRQRDLLARTGRDHFTLLLRGCDIHHAEQIAKKICSEINSYHDDYPDVYLPAWKVCASIIPIVAHNTVENTLHLLETASEQACHHPDQIISLPIGDWVNSNE